MKTSVREASGGVQIVDLKGKLTALHRQLQPFERAFVPSGPHDGHRGDPHVPVPVVQRPLQQAQRPGSA